MEGKSVVINKDLFKDIRFIFEDIRVNFLYMTREVLMETNRFINKQIIDSIKNYFFENQIGTLLKPKMEKDSLKKVKSEIEDYIKCDPDNKYQDQDMPKYMIFMNAYIDHIEKYQLKQDYIHLLYDFILSDNLNSAFSDDWMTQMRKKITAALLLGHFIHPNKQDLKNIFDLWANIYPNQQLNKVKKNFKNQKAPKISSSFESAQNKSQEFSDKIIANFNEAKDDYETQSFDNSDQDQNSDEDINDEEEINVDEYKKQKKNKKIIQDGNSTLKKTSHQRNVSEVNSYEKDVKEDLFNREQDKTFTKNRKRKCSDQLKEEIKQVKIKDLKLNIDSVTKTVESNHHHNMNSPNKKLEKRQTRKCTKKVTSIKQKELIEPIIIDIIQYEIKKQQEYTIQKLDDLKQQKIKVDCKQKERKKQERKKIKNDNYLNINENDETSYSPMIQPETQVAETQFIRDHEDEDENDNEETNPQDYRTISLSAYQQKNIEKTKIKSTTKRITKINKVPLIKSKRIKQQNYQSSQIISQNKKNVQLNNKEKASKFCIYNNTQQQEQQILDRQKKHFIDNLPSEQKNFQPKSDENNLFCNSKQFSYQLLTKTFQTNQSNFQINQCNQNNPNQMHCNYGYQDQQYTNTKTQQNQKTNCFENKVNINQYQLQVTQFNELQQNFNDLFGHSINQHQQCNNLNIKKSCCSCNQQEIDHQYSCNLNNCSFLNQQSKFHIFNEINKDDFEQKQQNFSPILQTELEVVQKNAQESQDIFQDYLNFDQDNINNFCFSLYDIVSHDNQENLMMIHQENDCEQNYNLDLNKNISPIGIKQVSKHDEYEYKRNVIVNENNVISLDTFPKTNKKNEDQSCEIIEVDKNRQIRRIDQNMRLQIIRIEGKTELTITQENISQEKEHVYSEQSISDEIYKDNISSQDLEDESLTQSF